MKNKNIRTLCGCKHFKKAFSLIKTLLVLIKKLKALHWVNFNIHIVSKGKKVNKLQWKLFDQHKVKFKNYIYFREKEAYNNNWNVFVQCSSRNKLRFFLQLLISKVSSPIFISWYLCKKELTCMLIHVCKIFSGRVSF